MTDYDFLPDATYTVTGKQLNRLMKREFESGKYWTFASICEEQGWSSNDFASEERSNNVAIAFDIKEIRSSGTIETGSEVNANA